jgi:TIR domain
MELLGNFQIQSNNQVRRIEFYKGDLTAIPPSQAVDCLVISAFPNDYQPTPTSLIGALNRIGISVADLAANIDVENDLRSSFSCWLSNPIANIQSFKRILCFEPLRLGVPSELTGKIFQALMPFVFGKQPIKSIAMPILAAGDQGFSEVDMLRSLFEASRQWLSHGTPIDTVKFFVYTDESANRLKPEFAQLCNLHSSTVEPTLLPRPYDFFISYSHDDSVAAQTLVKKLLAVDPNLNIFVDRNEIQIGDSWQDKIFSALEKCKKIIPIYSPSYLNSSMCKTEFNMASLRHNTNPTILPIYFRTTELPLYMKTIQYINCTENNLEKLDEESLKYFVNSLNQ